MFWLLSVQFVLNCDLYNFIYPNLLIFELIFVYFAFLFDQIL